MSNATNGDERDFDEKDLELIHPEIVDESAPWPPSWQPQGPFGQQQYPFGQQQGPFVWQASWPPPPQPPPTPSKPNWRLHILLFVATCLSTFSIYFVDVEHSIPQLSTMIWNGLCYAVPVMTILLCHEMGHYLQSKRYGVNATPPYFIPMPFSPLGTMGAFIVMRSHIKSRRALFDIGISGPLAGLVPTMIFLLIGLHYSTFEKTLHARATAEAGSYSLGSPLLLDFLVTLFRGSHSGNMVILHPMAFAGWVGLLVTSLNLIPIGQLDGGHVLYALLRKKAHKIAVFLLFAALFLSILYWETCLGWMVMIFLLLFLGPRHPPTMDDDEPLGWFRTILGWLTLAFIIIGFTPTPLVFSQ